MFKKTFKNIGIIARDISNKDILDTVKNLYEHLQNKKLNVYTDPVISGALNRNESKYEEIGKTCDLAVVVGGDGSILYASHKLLSYDIPIVGINRGKLGFLTDLPAQNFTNILDDILNNNYIESKLLTLSTDIYNNADNNTQSSKSYAVNDIVLNAGNITRMIDFDLYIDDQFVCNQKSDGIIIATPTGSTAYSLSAGGPILSPNLDAITLVPMFPHNLNSRPIVVPSTSLIKIVINSNLSRDDANYKLNPGISCDGGQLIYLKPNETIKISMSQNKLRLLHPKNYSYFETLRTKLHWNKKLI